MLQARLAYLPLGFLLCSVSVVFGCFSAYFFVTNSPVPESRDVAGPFEPDFFSVIGLSSGFQGFDGRLD
jgi:hypothetical protein